MKFWFLAFVIIFITLASPAPSNGGATCASAVRCPQHGLLGLLQRIENGTGGLYGVYHCTGNGQPHDFTASCGK